MPMIDVYAFAWTFADPSGLASKLATRGRMGYVE
jgi:hypothetical protein